MGASGIKDYDTIVQTLIAEIQSTQPNANLSIGSANRDLLIDVPASALAELYGEVAIAQEAQSVRGAIDTHLDRLLANWAIYRRPGTVARGSAWFYRLTIPIADIVIPAGTKISTTTTIESDAVDFVTTETITMIAAQASDYYNPNEDRYEIQVSIEAAYSGISGNVGPNNITAYTGTADISGVTNKTATSGGSGGETDIEMRARGLSVIAGVNAGTKAGYRILVLTVPEVQNAIVVDPNDTEMERVRDGGGADVWIETEETSEVTDTYTYAAGEVYRALEFRPALSISSVTANGVLLVPGVDYEFSHDAGSYKRSIYSRDRLNWIVTPTVGATIELTYTYCNLIQTLQDLLDESENHHCGADVLAKVAYTALVNVTMMVEVFTGYSPSDVTAAVNTTITTHIENLQLGDGVQQSDLIALTESVPGVDSVVLPLDVFTVTREVSGIEDGPDTVEGVPTGASTGNLVLRRFESPQPGTIQVNYYMT